MKKSSSAVAWGSAVSLTATFTLNSKSLKTDTLPALLYRMRAVASSLSRQVFIDWNLSCWLLSAHAAVLMGFLLWGLYTVLLSTVTPLSKGQHIPDFTAIYVNDHTSYEKQQKEDCKPCSQTCRGAGGRTDSAHIWYTSDIHHELQRERYKHHTLEQRNVTTIISFYPQNNAQV